MVNITRTYVDNLNKLIAGTEFADMPLEKIIAATAGKPDKVGIFNKRSAGLESHVLLAEPAAQWRRIVSAGLKQKIESSFGSVDACRKELANAAVTQFGSGWAWLVKDGDKLKVVKTGGNAEHPPDINNETPSHH